LRFQFLACLRFGVRQHNPNLTGAGWETKTLRASPADGMQIEVAVYVVGVNSNPVSRIGHVVSPLRNFAWP
jgi:hypothetical protein